MPRVPDGPANVRTLPKSSAQDRGKIMTGCPTAQRYHAARTKTFQWHLRHPVGASTHTVLTAATMRFLMDAGGPERARSFDMGSHTITTIAFPTTGPENPTGELIVERWDEQRVMLLAGALPSEL